MLMSNKLPKLSTHLDRGTQVAYIPVHVQEKYATLEEMIKDPATELGFITSGPRGDLGYFCRFWDTWLKKLRTLANSQIAPAGCVVLYESVPQEQVEEALKMYC